MAVDQLPGRVREFANYLDGLLAQLDQRGGWCAVFWQRDPDGMQACLDGREVPPWDVVESLLQDLAAEYGPGAAAAEAERARALHGAALTAYDARPGGRDALGDRFDVMLREQRYATERQADLSRLLATATTQEDADAIRLDLAWASDDRDRATRRCAELRARMEELDRHRAGGQAQAFPRGRGGPVHGPGAEGAPSGGRGPHDTGFPGMPQQRDNDPEGGPAARREGQQAGPPAAGRREAQRDRPGPSDGREARQARAGTEATGWGGDPQVAAGAGGIGPGAGWQAGAGAEATGRRGEPHARAGAEAAGWGGDPQVAAGAGEVGRGAGWQAGAGAEATGRRGEPQARAGIEGTGWRGDPHVAAGHGDIGPGAGWQAGAEAAGRLAAADPRDPRVRSVPRDAAAGDVTGEHASPRPTAHPQPAPADHEPFAEPQPAPKQRKRRRGSARFAGMAEEEAAPAVVPPEALPAVPVAPAAGGRTPRGARFAGAAADERSQPQAEPVDSASRREAVATVETLVRLRAEGRSGEAHALLVEAAYWPAARFPLLAAEMQRAGLGADWTTLLWEAASLPADRLVAAADALVEAGLGADGEQILRQGVARPAAEIGQAVRALAAEGRGREVRALLDAYVSVRTPEEAARSAGPDPQTLVPLLLEAARRVSQECHWDLVHALRVAGFTA